MSKPNPQVEALTRECRILRDTIARMRADPGDIPFSGCGDSSCLTRSGNGGVCTNGGCHCNERELRRAVQWWRRVAVFRLATIEELREQALAADFDPNESEET